MQNKGGEMNEYKFQGKYILKFDLKCLTGLHIGGTAEGLEIGGLDNPVIKDPLTEYPYIPGSSLKGKLRSLLEWGLDKIFADKKGNHPPHSCENSPEFIKLKEEYDKLQTDEERQEKNGEIKEKLKEIISSCPICQMFGMSASAEVGEPTRLTIRDSFPINDTIKDWEIWLGKNLYTEMKTENTIDRITSEANPRTMERVPANSVFKVEMVYDIFKDSDIDNLKYLFQAMELLEDSSLGGSGSRGHGKIKFENPEIVFRSKKRYYLKKDGQEDTVDLKKILKDNPISMPKLLFDKFQEIDWKKEKANPQDDNL